MSSSPVKSFLILAAIAAIGTQLGGCAQQGLLPPGQDPVRWAKNLGDYLNLRNGFMDPSQVGRFDKANPWGVSKPVTWPILEQLDVIDEPNLHWTTATDPIPTDLIVEQKEYIVGDGDYISFTVFELVTPGVPYGDQRQVNELGNITVQNLGQVHVSGLTPTQIEEKIGQLAVERGFLLPKGNGSPGPQVSVQLAQSRARIFSILGQVGGSGTYNIIGTDFRLMDALALAHDVAGGNQPGMDYLYVIRPNKGAGVIKSDSAPDATQPSTQPATKPSSTNPADLIDRLRTPGAAPIMPAGPTAEGPVFLRELPKSMLTMSDKPELLAQAGLSPLDAAISGGAPATQPVAAPAPAAPATTPTAAAGAPAATQPGDLMNQANPGRPGTISFDGRTVDLTPTKDPMGGMSHDEALAAAASLTAPRIIRIPIEKLKEGDPRYNIVIRPGDIINVPNIEPGEFYLYGQVGRAGVYSLTGRKVTLKMALAAAGGLTAVAIPRRCDLVRRVGNTEVTVQIDLQRIFDGEQPDIYLKANDWINVGTDMVAPFLAVTRNAYRASYGWGFVYDKNLNDSTPTPAAAPR